MIRQISRTLFAASLSFACTFVWADDTAPVNTPVATVAPTSSTTADQLLQRLEAVADQLDNDYFYDTIRENGLQSVFMQAQTDDLEVNPPQFYTEDMRKVTQAPWYLNAKTRALITELILIEDAARALPQEEQIPVIERWRSIFLTRLNDYVNYVGTLDPRYQLIFSLQAQYNSNVNRDPEGLTNNLSGRDDTQLTAVAGVIWKPRLKNGLLDSGINFQQMFTAIHLRQVAHKENEVAIFSTRPRIYRNYPGRQVESVELAYNFQHFSFSGKQDSRNTSSLFHSHRFENLLGFKAVPLNFKHVSSTRAKLKTGSNNKVYFDDSRQAQNAWDFTADYVQTFDLLYSKNSKAQLDVEVDFVHSSTKDTKASDYDEFTFKFEHRHSSNVKIGEFKRLVQLKEALSFRTKDRDRRETSFGNEDQYGLNLSASTCIKDRLMGSFALAYNEFDYSVPNNARQFQATVGLNWSSK